jgi:predicted outer membrane repeat protein
MHSYDSSSPILTGCVFTGNTATVSGGGAYFETTDAPSLSLCTFVDNQLLTSPMLGSGAGVYISSVNPATLV